MANFSEALELVLRDEGGFVNDPDDTPTNFGITQAVYSQFVNKPMSVSDVRAMPKDAAVAIYKTIYWKAIRGDDIVDQDTANAFLNMAVLRGTVAATKTMQAVAGLTQDGIVGTKTIAALNKSNYIDDFICGCVIAFARIAAANPSKLKFLVNWISRAQRFI